MAKKKKVKPPVIKVPSAPQIIAEIKKLEEMKPHVLKASIFGDNHHEAIEAVINVLERRWTTDDVYDEYPYATGEEDVEEVRENIHSAAVHAAEWMAGDGDGSTPSSNYAELDQRKKKGAKK